MREYYIIPEEGSEGGEEEDVECRLEQALEKGYRIIVIEPVKLGNMTIRWVCPVFRPATPLDHCVCFVYLRRWIRAGNFLHKSAVLASLGALVSLPALPHCVGALTALPLGLFGVACAGLYDISWQFDPCSQYQVDYVGTELASVPSLDLHSHTPVVLVRRNDKYRKRLHNTLALAVLGCIAWRLYRYFKNS